jgi:hypothetical protein
MIKMETKMLKTHHYDEAKLLRRYLAELREKEEAQHRHEFKQSLKKPMERLLARQEREQKELQEKVDEASARERFDLSQARRVRHQTHLGLQREMLHNHKMEWVKPKELPTSVQNAWPNRFDRSLTFAGSIMNSKFFGGDVELPSLCSLVSLDELYGREPRSPRYASAPNQLQFNQTM